MREVTLIELTTPHTQAIGVRILSSVVKEKQLRSNLIFMCGSSDRARYWEKDLPPYTEKTIEQIVKVSRNSDLVGISFLTNFFDGAVEITKKIKERLNIPVIWGGIHATAKPEEALMYADMVCLGEGENPFGELLEKMKNGSPYTDTRGIWFNIDGKIIKNPYCLLEQNLDKFPFPDYDFEGHYFFNKRTGELSSMTYEYLNLLSGNIYNIIMTRGCPSSCTFCYNSTWREKFTGGKYVRSRTVENVIKELSAIKSRFSFVNFIMFADDNFFAKSAENLNDFAAKYPSQVNLPFWAQITPLSVDEKRVELMINCGLRGISMGVQTASSKIGSIYKRPTDINNRILNAVNIFNNLYKKYKDLGMKPPGYDFILDSYWEEEDDGFENLELLLQFPKPFELHLASLVPYPGTKIYEKAKEENLIKDEITEIYRRPFMDFRTFSLRRNLPNLLIAYFEYLPNFLIRIMIHKKVRGFMSKTCPEFIFDFLLRNRIQFDRLSKLRHMIKDKDFANIMNAFRKAKKLKLGN